MKAIRYRIEALSPLLFTSNTGDPNMVSTLDYIPGTHLRGLFANEYIRKNNLKDKAEQDEKFCRWFLKGDVKFFNAHIATKDEKGQNIQYYPIPISVQHEKYHKKNYHDLLLNEEQLPDTKYKPGYCRLGEEYIYRLSVKKSLNFHHARDRERGTSKKGLIFNYESINEGQVFEGFITGSEEDLKEFKNIVSDGIYYLGRSRNNQYGKVRLEILSKQPEDFESEIKEYEIEPGDAVLTLISDTIIYNENGFSVVDVKEFEKVVGCKVKKAFIKATEEEGFISKWKLKTPQERCFKAGSCFLIEIKDEDIPRLKELQEKGIGEITYAGFGRFVIGWQRKETYQSEDNKKPEKTYKKPSQEVPEHVKNLISEIILDNLISYQQKDAIKKANEFIKESIKLSSELKKLPPPSLLSKLEKAVVDEKLAYMLTDDNLKATAKNNLEKCHSGKQTLLEFLRTYDLKFKDLIINIPTLKALCDEIGYSSTQETEEKLKKQFLLTFLSTMRKKAKEDKEKEAK